MAKRLTQDSPRLVGKPLHGEPKTAEAASAEATKRELQRCLKKMLKALNEAHLDIDDLRTSLGANGDGDVPKQIHPFLIGGM